MFFNDRTARWTTARLTSNPIKYYKKHGRYHNFKSDAGDVGGHYFNPHGMWSLLTEDHTQAPPQPDPQFVSNPEVHLDLMESSFFIDDDYLDQMDLSFENSSPPFLQGETLTFYPSIASFPDFDVQIPRPINPRTRFMSSSEPDLPSNGCHRSIQNRLRQWGSAIRDVWASTSILNDDVSMEDLEEREERKEAATPH